MPQSRMAHQRRIALMLIAFLSLSGFARADQRFPTAITGVTIHSGDGTSIENGVILIDDGRITAVGDGLTPPPHARTIDAEGMHAYPGFISAHAHLGIPDEKRSEDDRQRLEDENPDVRHRAMPATRFANRRGILPQFRAQYVVDIDKKSADKFRTLGITTILAAPRGGILGGSSALLNLSDEPLRRTILAADVAQHASFSAYEPGRYPRSILGVFASFRQVMLDAQRAIQVERYYDRHPHKTDRPPTDPALIALRPVLRGDVPVIFEAGNEHEIRRALDLGEEFDLRIIISGAKEAYKVIDRIRDEKVPLIVTLDFDEEPEYGKKKKGSRKRERKPKKEAEDPGLIDNPKPDKPAKDAKSTDDTIYEPLKVRKERRRLWEEQVANIIRLHEAGIPFSLSTRDFKKPADLIKNLRLVIERGLPEDAALAALTRTPSVLFGLDDQIGLLAPGYLADIVVMTKPLSDEKTKVRHVVVDGERFEYNRDDKDKKKGKDKNDESDDDPELADADEPQSDDEPDTAESEPAESDVAESEDEDTGPTWPSEIDADRVPTRDTQGNVLLTNATVITITGQTLENASVLVQNGKIAAVGRAIAPPSDVTVIDCTDRYIIPGMVDAHSHMSVDGVNEGTISITAEVRVGDVVRNDSTGIYRALAGGVTTTHTMHGSANPIGGQNVIFKMKYKRPVSDMIIHDAHPTIKWALGENVKQSNSDRARGKRFPNGRMGVEAVIRDALVAGQQYAAEWDDYRKKSAAGEDILPPRRDLRLEALAGVLSGDIWVHTHCYRSDEIVRLMATAEDFGIRIAVLQHVLEGYRVAPEIARHGASASTFSNFWAYKIEAYGAIPHNAALMTNHGIVTSINSDSPNTIRYFDIEAAKSIKWGDLDEIEALKLVTLNPAMQLGLDDRLGSIEVGKDGDLAVFNGHPLNSFSRCVMTLIEGEVYFEDDDPDPTADAGPLDWNKPVDMTLPQSPHRLYAITGGTVHPISAPKIENGTVIIRNGLIDAVGGPDLRVPPGAGVVDARGMHVYPGMIDGGGALGLTEIGSLRATRDFFDIAQFGPELRTITAVHPHSQHIRIARTAGITTQLAQPEGGTISGQSALIHLDGWTADEMLVKDRVALHMSVPSLPANLSGENKKEREKRHEESIREIEEFLGLAKRYAAAVEANEKIDRDLRLEAMIPCIRGDQPVIFSATGYKQILDTIEFAEKHELKPILSGAREAWKLADTLAEKDIPVIFSEPLAYPRGRFETWDSVYRCAAILDNAGVRWCFSTDSAANVYDLGLNAGMAVAFGLSPDRAMRALTLSPAQILGIDNEFGSLEAGKRADIIVTNHPPTQTVSRLAHLFINGRPIPLTSMHTESYEKFKNRPEPNLPPQQQLIGPAYRR